MEVQQKYGTKLSQIIIKLLEPDVEKRLKPSQLIPLKGDPVKQFVVYPIQAAGRVRSTSTSQVIPSIVHSQVHQVPVNSKSRISGINQTKIGPPVLQINQPSQSPSRSFVQFFPSTTKSIHRPAQNIIQFPTTSSKFYAGVNQPQPISKSQMSSPINDKVKLEEKLLNLDKRINEVLKKSQNVIKNYQQ